MRLFVDNVYEEVLGKEAELAQSYACSLILEKLLKISDQFQLRVFADKLSGRYVSLTPVSLTGCLIYLTS